MPEPKGNDVQRTLAVRVSPDYHAQLSTVAQVDEMTLVDLMMTALDKYMASPVRPLTSRRRYKPRSKRPKLRWHEPGPCCWGHCPSRRPGVEGGSIAAFHSTLSQFPVASPTSCA